MVVSHKEYLKISSSDDWSESDSIRLHIVLAAYVNNKCGIFGASKHNLLSTTSWKNGWKWILTGYGTGN